MEFLTTLLLAARLLLAGGPFHGAEVGAKPLQGWWALSGSSRENLTWGPVKPSFKAVLDVIGDDDAAKPTGVAIAVGLADPIFLARELGLTSPGRVPTQFLEAGGLDLGSPEPPQFPFKLSVTSPRAFTVEEQRTLKPSHLIFTQGSRRQVLYSWPTGLTDQAASLVWAGDLDRDGKLDFYLVLSQHYNIQVHTLFLHPAPRPVSW